MILLLAGIFGASSIALGAYGAHGLKYKANKKTVQSFKNAVHYQQLHSITLLLISVLGFTEKQVGLSGLLITVSGWLFVAGILLFSGSIYASTFTGKQVLTKITPVGGFCFIAGWLLLAGAGIVIG